MHAKLCLSDNLANRLLFYAKHFTYALYSNFYDVPPKFTKSNENLILYSFKISHSIIRAQNSSKLINDFQLRTHWRMMLCKVQDLRKL